MNSDSPNTADIVERLLATRSRVPERPTIAELEAILTAPDPAPIEIMPNGEVRDAGGLVNPDGPEAAAIIERYEEALKQIKALKAKPIGDSGFVQGPAVLLHIAQQFARAALKDHRKAQAHD